MTYAAFGLLLIINCQFTAKTSQYQKAKTYNFHRVRIYREWGEKNALNKKKLPEKQTNKNKINTWLVQVCNSVTTLLSNIACGTDNTMFFYMCKKRPYILKSIIRGHSENLFLVAYLSITTKLAVKPVSNSS